MASKAKIKKGNNSSQEGSIYFLLALFVVLPLAMSSKFYFDIDHVKYFWLRVIAIGGASWFTILTFINAIGTNKVPFAKAWKRWNVIDYLFLFFLGLNIITWISSGQLGVFFIGSNDRQMGLQYYLWIALIYFTVRIIDWSDEKLREKTILVASIGTIIVMLIALFQFLGIDFGGQLALISEEERYNFLSTIGNTAVFAKYICIICTVLFYQLMMSKKTSYILKLTILLYGSALVYANVDALVLGVAVGFGITLLVALRKNKVWEFVNALAVYFLGILLFKLLYFIAPNPRNIYTIGRVLLNLWPLFLVYIIFILLLNRLYFKERDKFIDNRKLLSVLYKVILSLGILGTLGVIIALFYFSVLDNKTNLGKLENYLRFTDEWGTQRGYVWRFVIEIFKDASIKNKICGHGQGSVPGLIYNYSADFMIEKYDYYFDNAHNTYLQLLLSHGILGTFCYILIQINAFLRGRKEEATTGFAIALASVVAMDIVCIYEPITGPYIWLLIAFCACAKCGTSS